MSEDIDKSHKIKLEGLFPDKMSEEVIFEASMNVSEKRSIQYEDFIVNNSPSDIKIYNKSSNRTFSISGKLISRTKEEAIVNAWNVDNIRSWILPDFGTTGAPPPILRLTAYKNNNITSVPCIMKSYSITFGDDVDFIYDSEDNNFIPMPVVLPISIELDEILSGKDFKNKEKWKINKKAEDYYIEQENLKTINTFEERPESEPSFILEETDPASGITTTSYVNSNLNTPDP